MTIGGYDIPFNKAYRVGTELDYIADAFARGHVSGDGEYTGRCSAILQEVTDAERVLLTTSCTHALELAAILLELGPGDEVIVPSFTFVSTANAFALRGATPVFCDVRPDTLNLDERLLEDLVTDRTRAVVPVHYGGISCDMEAICDIAERNGLAVVEDNAHGLFGSFRGEPLGSFGTFATLSFHETKNVSCGEGGALLINDPAYIERAEIIREKGTNRARFFRGEVDRYTWVDVGSSFLPSDILAAALFSQLEVRQQIQARRRAVWERYCDALADWGARNDVGLPVVPDGCEPAYHLFHLMLPSGDARTRFIERLKAAGILTVFHYQSLHLSQMGQRFGGRPGDCPVTEAASDRLVRLPFFYGLDEARQDRVIEEVLAFST